MPAVTEPTLYLMQVRRWFSANGWWCRLHWKQNEMTRNNSGLWTTNVLFIFHCEWNFHSVWGNIDRLPESLDGLGSTGWNSYDFNLRPSATVSSNQSWGVTIQSTAALFLFFVVQPTAALFLFYVIQPTAALFLFYVVQHLVISECLF